MRAGELTHRLRIERRVSVPAAAGSSTPRDVPIPSTAADGCWSAKIEPLSARELVAAAAAQMLATHKITTYYVEGLDPSCRMLETRHGKTRVFHLSSVIDVGERHVEHQSLAVEKVSA